VLVVERGEQLGVEKQQVDAEIARVARAIELPGGGEAVNLKVAEKYVEAFAGIGRGSDQAMGFELSGVDFAVVVAVEREVVRVVEPNRLAWRDMAAAGSVRVAGADGRDAGPDGRDPGPAGTSGGSAGGRVACGRW
jgi:hypothetical protein